VTIVEEIIPIVIGAGASALLIPYFTSIWQVHQKELEIRVDLVRRISQTVMGMMTMIDSIVTTKPLKELNKKEVNKEYRKFKVDSAVIGTELDSYFPNQEIGKEWDKLKEDIEKYFEVAKSDGDIGKTDIERKKKEIGPKKHVIILLVLNRPMARFSLRPSITGWIKSKADARKLNYYHKQIASLYRDDSKLDENDIEALDQLRSNIVDAYSKGKINDKHYDLLNKAISNLESKER